MSFARTAGSRKALRCSASGQERTSFHSGEASKGSCVLNDSTTLNSRAWAWPNMRPPAAAVWSSSSSMLAVLAVGRAAARHAERDRHAGLDGQVRDSRP